MKKSLRVAASTLALLAFIPLSHAMAQNAPPDFGPQGGPPPGGVPSAGAPQGGSQGQPGGMPGGSSGGWHQGGGGPREACRSDVQTFCQGVQPGGGRIKDCLQDHYKQISDACYTALKNAPQHPPQGQRGGNNGGPQGGSNPPPSNDDGGQGGNN